MSRREEHRHAIQLTMSPREACADLDLQIHQERGPFFGQTLDEMRIELSGSKVKLELSCRGEVCDEARIANLLTEYLQVMFAGQALLTGQAIRISGPVAWTGKRLTYDDIAAGMRAASIAMLVPYLRLALRDFNLFLTAWRTDAPFYALRCLESIARCILGTKGKIKKHHIESFAEAGKPLAGVAAEDLRFVWETANHFERQHRHATKHFLEESERTHLDLRGYGPIVIPGMTIDRSTADVSVHTPTLTDDEWKRMCRTLHRSLVKFINYLVPHALRFRVVPPWRPAQETNGS